jgi:hypothetical protein
MSKASNNVVLFKVTKEQKSFSGTPENGQKITLKKDTSENAEAPENVGVTALAAHSPSGQFGSKSKTQKLQKNKTLKSKPDTPSPSGYQYDADTLSATALRLSYPLTYSSWKNRKAACKAKAWPWSPAWEIFSDFLKSMGPRPSQQHTLDRVDNSIQAYGPDLCQWADKTVQNNNKSDNIKIIIPITGTAYTSHQLAKKHKVSLKTIHNWYSKNFTSLEMLAGKQDKDFQALTLALYNIEAQLPPKPPKGLKPPIKKLVVPELPSPTRDDPRSVFERQLVDRS